MRCANIQARLADAAARPAGPAGESGERMGETERLLDVRLMTASRRDAMVVAYQVIDQYLRRHTRGPGGTPLPDPADPFDSDQGRTDAVCAALMDDEGSMMRRVLLPGLDSGWSAPLLAEQVIPGTAARLGEWWTESSASFAEVSVGCVRLHEMLRLLRDLLADSHLDADRDEDVLLLVPETDHHSLAAAVAAYRFRRLGVGVRQMAGMAPRQVAGLLRHRRYAMVGISVGSRQSLLQSRALIAMIRATVPRPVPIVIGGPALGLDMEMVRKTGADCATNDPEAALDFCGIPTIYKRDDKDG
jgi:methanogenic corrinoid protein MtbC1